MHLAPPDPDDGNALPPPEDIRRGVTMCAGSLSPELSRPIVAALAQLVWGRLAAWNPHPANHAPSGRDQEASWSVSHNVSRT